MQSPAFTIVAGMPKSLSQSVTKATPQRCPPRRVAADVDAIGVTVESRGVFINPCNRAAHLCRQHGQIASDVFDRGEIGHDVMRPRLDEHLRGISGVEGTLKKPIAAGDENEDRGLRTIGPKDIQLFNFCGAIGAAAWRTEAGAHGLAIGDQAIRRA
jgi:hypothetical protein